MTSFQVWIEGQPKPQPRARAFARKVKGGATVARMFDAGTAEAWKSCVAEAVRPHLPAKPETCAFAVWISIHLARPASHYGRKKGQPYLKPDAPRSHTGRGDADNFAKAVLDALTRLSLWKDDGQVAELHVTKNYTESAPGAWLRVAERKGA